MQRGSSGIAPYLVASEDAAGLEGRLDDYNGGAELDSNSIEHGICAAANGSLQDDLAFLDLGP